MLLVRILKKLSYFFNIILKPNGKKETIFSLFVIFIFSYTLAINISYTVGRIINPKRAYYNGCLLTNSLKDSNETGLCLYANHFVEKVDILTESSLTRDGSYPITITFVHGLQKNKILGISHIYPLKCDIEIDQDYALSTIEELDIILLHEILHCYGVDHDKDNIRSVMYPSSNGLTTIEEFAKALVLLHKQAN